MKKYIPYIIIAVLLASLVVSLTNRKEVVTEKVTSDTVTITRTDTIHDTVFYKKPTFITEVIVDTVFVEKSENGDYVIAITQRYYKDNGYEAWVSGCKPSLDSINVFGKTITNTITNTVTETRYVNTTDVFLNAGVDYISGDFAPNIGASVKFRNGLLLGGNVGYYNKGAYYGVKLGYKLNK